MKIFCKKCKSEDVIYNLNITDDNVYVILELTCNACLEVETTKIIRPKNFSVTVKELPFFRKYINKIYKWRKQNV